jgi:hypothetical protein
MNLWFWLKPTTSGFQQTEEPGCQGYFGPLVDGLKAPKEPSNCCNQVADVANTLRLEMDIAPATIYRTTEIYGALVIYGIRIGGRSLYIGRSNISNFRRRKLATQSW